MRYFAHSAGVSAVRKSLACGASAAALVLGASPALAQDEAATPADEAASASTDQSAIIVTGSRLITNGMTSPVPITVVDAEELEAMNPTSLIASVSNLPQFYGNQTPNNSNFFVRGGTGNLNLRGLGVNRTLTLLNGRRFPSSSAFGGVDINLFPEAMIRSVETTTGGGSAAYGTDAVAGVVNFILDTDYTGFQVDLQGGITQRGDAQSYEGSVSWGTNIGDRGHFLISGTLAHQDGIRGYADRNWYNGQAAILDPATNTYRTYENVHSMNASFDGIIFAPGTALANKAFDANGNLVNFTPGSFSTGTVGAYGARTSGGDGDDLFQYQSIWPETDRNSVFAYADYDVTENLNVFGQFTRGQNGQVQTATPAAMINLVPVFTTATIYSGNAFLPADVQAIMDANGIASFRLGRIGHPSDFGNIYYEDVTTQNVGTAGFKYKIDDGPLNGWSVDGFYQYGHSRRVWDQYGFRVDRIHAALDAVVDPATGNIVCNVSLYADGAAAFPGCVPLNPFGRGNASSEAVDYVTGNDPGVQIDTPIFFADTGYDLGKTYSYTTSEPKRNITTFKQQYAELSAAGNLFEGWAGPISLALGGSYRKDSILQLVQDQTNPPSDHVSGRPVLCSGAVGGLRHANTDCNNTVGFQFSKVSNIRGSSRVWEVFGETLVPLFDNHKGTSAVVNLAARYADYDAAGGIWAYKGGLDFSVFDDLRLRGTYSRDVRAGNLSERFDRTGGVATGLDDPRTPNVIESLSVTSFSGGNPAIKPEKADTYTIGGVYSPSWLNGLSLAVDWYKIKIKGAIGRVGFQEVLNRCLGENAQEFCDLITLNSAGDIILVGDAYVNVDQAAVEGIDVELGYRTPVKLFGGGEENLGIRTFASWLLERSDTNSTGITTDLVGQIGLRPSSGLSTPYTRFKATANVNYTNGPFSFFVTGRVVGGGKVDTTLTEGDGVVGGVIGIEQNDVPATFYADLRLAYQFDIGAAGVELWGAVSNLLDQDPRITGYYAAFPGQIVPTNTSLYDILGRRFTLGVKVKL
ncbi:TonB-dependent receptor domain-containing protein [Croceibacterium aestuarii]|uniref:TonB-dependent receptor domain-containing protein n=1 Tax=Croceibacterium aestuarii TaxID=3064139 RepID=UPI00272EE105|nr:TonB-dependent receptor [Croceibacterium sp. D39]